MGRAVGAVVAQQLYTLWVGGSNPSPPTISDHAVSITNFSLGFHRHFTFAWQSEIVLTLLISEISYENQNLARPSSDLPGTVLSHSAPKTRAALSSSSAT